MAAICSITFYTFTTVHGTNGYAIYTFNTVHGTNGYANTAIRIFTIIKMQFKLCIEANLNVIFAYINQLG